MLKDLLRSCCLDLVSLPQAMRTFSPLNFFTSTLLSSWTAICSVYAYSSGEQSYLLLDDDKIWKGKVLPPGRGSLVTIPM